MWNFGEAMGVRMEDFWTWDKSYGLDSDKYTIIG